MMSKTDTLRFTIQSIIQSMKDRGHDFNLHTINYSETKKEIKNRLLSSPTITQEFPIPKILNTISKELDSIFSTSEIETLRNENNKLMNELHSTTRKLENLDNEYRLIKQERDSLKEENRLKAEIISDTQNRVNIEIDKLSQKIKELTISNKNLIQASTLPPETINILDEYVELKDKYESTSKHCNELSEDVEYLKQEVERLEQAIEGYESICPTYP